ncbi:MAG: hypothetical protein AAFU86_01865 [Pseudomonadota bacterium]
MQDGFDVFLPLVDDDAIDMILRGKNGRKLDLQVKARFAASKVGNGGLFHGIPHPSERSDYFFLFYAESADAMWFMSSTDFLEQSTRLRSGKRNIGLTGRRSGKEFPKEKFMAWLLGHDGQLDFAPVWHALGRQE